MTPDDALYHLVHDFPGGAPSLAPRMGLSHKTLENMADPCQETHGWPLRRMVQAMQFTKDLRPLEALCELFGGMFVPTGEAHHLSNAQLLKSMQRFAAEFGDIPRAIEDALANDGKISANELKRIEQEGMELVQAWSVVLSRVRELYAAHAILPENERP